MGGGDRPQSRSRQLTPLRYFPCWESSTIEKQRPAVKRNLEEQWQPSARSDSKGLEIVLGALLQPEEPHRKQLLKEEGDGRFAYL